MPWFSKLPDLKNNPLYLEPRVSATESQLAQKVSQSDFNMAISNIGSGRPKGVYSTLSDLQTAFPTGDNNIYLVTADGKWYYWSGSTWTAGGIYQATGLSNGENLDNEINFFKSNYGYVNDVTLNNGQSFIPNSKSVLKMKYLSNDKTTVGVPDPITPIITQSPNSLTLPDLLQGEQMDDTYIYQAWRAYKFQSLNWSYYGMQTNGAVTFYRLNYTPTADEGSNIQGATSIVNVLNPSGGKFTSTSQVNGSTPTTDFMYIKGTDKSINIFITQTEFDIWNAANGGNKTINDYVNTLDDFTFYVALISKVQQSHNYSFSAYKGTEVTFSPSDVKCRVKWYREDKTSIDNDFIRYETTVKNPLSSTAYTNDLIQLYASFPKGVCKNENCIVVSDSNGNTFPHQWEDDRPVSFKFDKNVGRYNDGSLKNGTIWITDSIGAGASKTYYVDVYDTDVSSYSVSVSDVYASDVLTVSTSVVALKFEKARKMTLSNVAYKGVNKYASSTEVVALRYNDTLSTVRSVYSYGTLVGYKVNGSGVVFKEFEGVWDLDNKFRFTLRIKLFSNNEIRIKYFAKALNALATTDAYGTSVQLAYPITNVTTDRNFYDIGVLASKMTCIDWLEDSKTMVALPYYAHGDIPRDDMAQPTYPATNTVAISTDRAIIAVGWAYGGSDTLYPIDKDRVFSGGIVLDTSGYTDSTNEDTNRIFNQLCGRITKEPLIMNERKLLDKLLDWIQHMDYNYVETYAPSQLTYPYMSKYILYKYKNLGNLSDLITYFKSTVAAYFGDGVQAALINAFNTTTSAGYQMTSRIIPMARYYRDECIKNGDTTNQAYMEQLLKSWAELSCQLVESKGFTPLTYTDTTGNSNSVAAGLKALSFGLDLDPTNVRWQNAYNTNLAYFNTMLSAVNIIQENGSTKLQKGHYLHYASYAMFDYLQATKHTDTLKPLVYMMEATTPSGAAKEQEYCISASRRGLGHTNAYMIYGLVKERTPYSIEHAHKILDNVINQANMNGGHKFPLENWELQSASSYSTSAYIEMQAYGESIMMLDGRI